MKEIYRIIIEFKNLQPLLFWADAFTLISSFILVIWSFLIKKIYFKKQEIVENTTETESKYVQHNIKTEKEYFTSNEKEIKTNNFNPFKSSNKVKESDFSYEKVIETNQFINKSKIAIDESRETYIHKEQNSESTDESTNPKNERKIENISEIVLKPESKEQLPPAKIETKKSDEKIIFVDYDFSKDETTNLYPIIRFPKKGTIVRSYRIGYTKRRGYKEESFQRSLFKYFGKEFEVLGNIRLNTGKETRPFEPDIAIIDKSNSTGLRMDIEIDEPYAGITREHTHCKGHDINRDIYFTDRGWVVIRFSEHQVHLFENECLKFIAQILKIVKSDFKIPIQLENISTFHFEGL